jgi:serine/threonine/tyrosine protein kinase RAD53
MCGTPSYLAPEVVMQTNSEGYHHVVDSWSMGVIVFSMYVFIIWSCLFHGMTVSSLRLTNTNPFIEDDTQRDLRIRIAGRQIDWTTLEQSQVSEEGQQPYPDDSPHTYSSCMLLQPKILYGVS